MSVTHQHVDTTGADYDAIWGLTLALDPDSFGSAEELRQWDQRQLDAGRMNVRILAWDGTALVGTTIIGQVASLAPDHAWMNLRVHPERHAEGIGRGLLEEAEAAGRHRGIVAVIGAVRENESRSLRFASAAGYEEIDREWWSMLDLTTFDPDSWSTAIAAVLSSGIRFATVAELGERFFNDTATTEIYTTLEGDIPENIEIVRVSFDDWMAQSIDSPQALPEGFFVAFDGGQMVGLTELVGVDEQPTALSQELTGVLESHQGRGIATALKAHALSWAKRSGYRRAKTSNAQSNAPMLAVNTKLGFARDHGRVIFRKDLGP
jgi:GNAT superfamily N-acetyltransferase